MKTDSSKRTKKRSNPIDAFIALPHAEKERIWQEIDGKTHDQLLAESRPLNAKERAQWRKFKNKAGRPQIGKGAKMVALSIELGLLKRADAYAMQHGLKRSELIAKGLETVLGKTS